MTAFVVVDITVQDAETYEEYKRLAPPSIARYGGRYIVRGGQTSILEGDWSPSRLVILEFQTVDAARDWWASPEYAEAKALRQRCATADMVLVAGMLAAGQG